MSDETHRPGQSRNPKPATRRTRAIGVLVLAGIVALVGYWASEQFSPPDIGEPFDVDAFKSYTLPDEQNAFTFYRQAAALLVSEETVFASNATLKRQDFWDSWAAAEQGWEHAIPAVRQWVKLNRGVLDAFEQGRCSAPRASSSPFQRYRRPRICRSSGANCTPALVSNSSKGCGSLRKGTRLRRGSAFETWSARAATWRCTPRAYRQSSASRSAMRGPRGPSSGRRKKT